MAVIPGEPSSISGSPAWTHPAEWTLPRWPPLLSSPSSRQVAAGSSRLVTAANPSEGSSCSSEGLTERRTDRRPQGLQDVFNSRAPSLEHGLCEFPVTGQSLPLKGLGTASAVGCLSVAPYTPAADVTPSRQKHHGDSGYIWKVLGVRAMSRNFPLGLQTSKACKCMGKTHRQRKRCLEIARPPLFPFAWRWPCSLH